MFWLMEPYNTTTKGTHIHTHTHTHTPQYLLADQTIPGTSERLCSASSSWVAETTPRRRVRNRTFLLCLSWFFFWKSWGCPSGWRGWESVPLFIGPLCRCDVSWTHGCPFHGQGFRDVIFNMLLGKGQLSHDFVILVLRTALREAQLNLDIWPVDWVRYHNAHLIFQG